MQKISIVICLIISSLTVCMAENGWDTVCNFKPNKYMFFDMEARNNVIAIAGHQGAFLLSENNGLSWKNIYLGTNSTIYKLSFLNDTILFLCGDYGTLVKYNIKSGLYNDFSKESYLFFKSIAFFDNNYGLAGTIRGLIYKTTNGGQTWDSVFNANLCIQSIAYKNHNEVLFTCSKRIGDTSEIYYSKDAGLNWTKIVKLNAEKINALTYIDNELWIGGSYGLLASSKDDGKNWEFYNFDVTAPIWKIVKFNNDIYVACGWEDHGIVKVIPSTDTFTLDLNSSNKTIFDISTNNDYIFTVNNHLGIIYRKKK